jgi:hypothetical protein
MKKIILAFFLGVLMHVGGCALFQSYQEPVSTQAPVVCNALTADGAKSACAEAGDALIKAYVTLDAVDLDIKQTAPTGIWTKAQAQSYLDRSKDARKKLDKAWEVFASGDYQSALSSANVTATLITDLEQELAKQAAKGGK